MPRSLIVSLNLGTGFEGLQFYAQIVKADGTNLTSFISDGFAEIGGGYYLWDYSNFPENFRGGIKFYDQTDTDTVLVFTDISTSTDCSPKAIIISINLGAGFSGLNLAAQIVRADGSNLTNLLTFGFADIGEGYYLWDYTNLPQNFRGGIKFYNQADLNNILAFIEINTEQVSYLTKCEDCIYQAGEQFDITYSDQRNLNFYAILFSATDLTKAFNPTTLDFETYTIQNHTNFILTLNEDNNRLGWYSYYITDLTNIPNVIGDQYYFIEVWQRIGATPNRLSDVNTGNLKVCWGRENWEWLQTAKTVWEFGTRTLTEIAPTITPEQIWTYAERTLTGSVSCDYTDLEKAIITAIEESTGQTIDEIQKSNDELSASIDKTFKLLETCCNGTSNLKNNPIRIGLPGSKGANSSIRIT